MRAAVCVAILVLSTAQLYAQTEKVDSDQYRSRFEKLNDKLRSDAEKVAPKDYQKELSPVDPCKINPTLPQCLLK